MVLIRPQHAHDRRALREFVTYNLRQWYNTGHFGELSFSSPSSLPTHHQDGRQIQCCRSGQRLISLSPARRSKLWADSSSYHTKPWRNFGKELSPSVCFPSLQTDLRIYGLSWKIVALLEFLIQENYPSVGCPYSQLSPIWRIGDGWHTCLDVLLKDAR